MPTLNELFESGKDVLAGINWSDDKAREAAVEAVKTHANQLYMAINNLGFGAGQARMQKQFDDAEAARKKAEQDLQTAQGKITELTNKTPDVATVNQQWQTKLTEQDKAHEQALAQKDTELMNVLYERDQALYQSELEKLGVPRSMAQTIARNPDLPKTRWQYEKGKLSVLQAGQQIPFAPGQNQTHLGLLAAETVAGFTQDEKDLLHSNGDRGSNVTNGGPQGKGDTSFYDGIRTEAKKEQSAGTPRVSLAERMKNRG